MQVTSLTSYSIRNNRRFSHHHCCTRSHDIIHPPVEVLVEVLVYVNRRCRLKPSYITQEGSEFELTRTYHTKHYSTGASQSLLNICLRKLGSTMSTSSSPSDPTTLNIPSLLVFAVISVFAIRYFFFTSPSSSTASSSSSNGRRVPADRIEQVASMFPQVSRREIEYDLSRNGANVASTTERVLREGRLPMVSRLSAVGEKQRSTN